MKKYTKQIVFIVLVILAFSCKGNMEKPLGVCQAIELLKELVTVVPLTAIYLVVG